MRNNNKKMKTTWLSLFLAFALLFTSLTGCGSTEPSDTSNISTEQDSASELDSATEITSETDSETESDIASETDSETQTEVTTESEKESEKNSESSSTQNNNNTSTGNSNSGSSNTGNSKSGSSNSGNSNSGSSNSGSSNTGSSTTSTDLGTSGISLSQIPAYSTSYYITLNNNVPHFSTKNLSTTAYEFYSDLDSLGRCGVAYACLGTELMPTEDRGNISSVKPTGWHSTNYSCVPGSSLYNRSHLIAFSLSGENANKLNLITGTQHMNQIEMTKFEDMVRDYIKETGNHVLYRVTPFFDGNNLVATGVQMEAWSIEDNGESICFNVFIYNVQDGITIDYATGASYETDPSEETESEETVVVPDGAKFAVNNSNGKIHIVGECSATKSGSDSAMKDPIYFDTYEEALAYVKEHFPKQEKPQCGNCW